MPEVVLCLMNAFISQDQTERRSFRIFRILYYFPHILLKTEVKNCIVATDNLVRNLISR